jgi:hypothetical protein
MIVIIVMMPLERPGRSPGLPPKPGFLPAQDQNWGR